MNKNYKEINKTLIRNQSDQSKNKNKLSQRIQTIKE